MTKTIAARLMLAGMLGMGLAGCGIFKGGGHKTPTIGERVPILVSENAAEVDKSLAAVAVSLPPAELNPGWAQAGGSADKSNGQLALAASPRRIWTSSITGGTDRARLGAAPVIDGGKLFAIDVDAVVHAIDANSGAALWQVPLASGKKNRAARFGGGVSVEDGRVYATDGLGDVVALAAADGKQLWRVKPGGPLRGSPTLANGNVYILSQDNQLFALSEADGTVAWTQTASIESQGVFGVAAPASSQGTVVAGFSSGELNAYRYENGRTLWQDALSRTSATTSVSSIADVDADPVIEDGRVYAVGQGGRMVAVDISTGQRVWEQNFAGISTPWIAGEWLFIVTDDARLVCVARATGKVRWIAQLQHYRKEKARKDAVTWFGPVLAGGRLILTNSLGQIAYRSPADGAVVTLEKGTTPYTLPPVVANATLYLIDQRGRISAYR
ncbi:PQQ-binding-like beta-propeller repeat protein [Sphingomonas bacterium]|uniref:PQQ-binding-like beta-propeller repeat protein n=1 Tax=Sphingomonas bacterium TaxID=1895847 RepID=UPI001575299C|nr:PQQ-binding-like beta-propeller repeat protein [Sphingomonas bacterium]